MSGIIQAIHRWRHGPKASTYTLTGMGAEALREFLRVGGGGDTESGVPVNDTAALKVAAAWRCVQIIAGTVATLPMDLIIRTDERRRDPAKDHPLRRVLTVKPNLWQTPNEFRRMLQSHLMLRGNAYALKVMLGDQVAGLIPIHPDRVMVEQLPDMTIEYIVTRIDGSVVRRKQTEILHLRGLSLDGVTGLSVLSYMREALGLALVSEKAGAKLMKNGSFATGVLKHPSRLGKEAMDNLRESWDARYGGSENSGRPIILEEAMEYTPLSMSATDAQFLGLRDFQRYDIAMFFGVPPHMLGATEKTTSWGSGIEAQGIGFVIYTLNDWLRIWEEALKRDCLPEHQWNDHDIRFFTQGLLRGDFKTRWEGYLTALQWGVLSPDEVRGLEDMNPRTDAKGHRYYDPPNTAGTPADQKDTGDEQAPPADDFAD